MDPNMIVAAIAGMFLLLYLTRRHRRLRSEE